MKYLPSHRVHMITFKTANQMLLQKKFSTTENLLIKCEVSILVQEQTNIQSTKNFI